MKLIPIIIISCFLVISHTCSGEISSFKYADYLYESGLYELAIPEYYRTIYCGTDSDTIRGLLGVALCYTESGKYIEASGIYEQIEMRDKFNWNAVKNHTSLLTDIKHFYESNLVINKHINLFPIEHQDTLRLYNAVNWVNLGKFDKAKDVLSDISTGYPKLHAESLLGIMDEHLPLKNKNKTKAVLLQAILPGAGYLYCNMPQTALATLVVNSIMGFAMYDSFNKNNNGSGVFFSVIGIGFYLGSIYGSFQALDKYNNRELEKFSRKIQP